MSRGGTGCDLGLTASLWLLGVEGTEGGSRDPSEEAPLVTQVGNDSGLAQVAAVDRIRNGSIRLIGFAGEKSVPTTALSLSLTPGHRRLPLPWGLRVGIGSSPSNTRGP